MVSTSSSNSPPASAAARTQNPSKPNNAATTERDCPNLSGLEDQFSGHAAGLAEPVGLLGARER